MINRKNLSRLSIGCLILGLAAIGSIFMFGCERGQLEQSYWDKALDANTQQGSVLAEMQASVELQMRDLSYVPPASERRQRQGRLDALHHEELNAHIQALKLEGVRCGRNDKLLAAAIGFGAASILGAILLFITRPQAAKQNP
jgi:predicted Fe-S protein YdhL (DUF1289 family)